MNILLSNECNRRCSYCFAQERVRLRRRADDGTPAESHGAPRFISQQDYRTALRFVKTARDPAVGILGGEPSLHPEFVSLLEEAWQEKLHTKIFSNGLWRASDVDWLAGRTFSREPPFHVVLNVNEPERMPEPERAAQERFLDKLGRYCTLSCNISRLEMDFGYLVDLVTRHKTRGFIRLGMAQPLAALDNEHIPPEQYAQLAEKIVALAERADRQGVSVGFDCGFVLCMFNETELGRLALAGLQFRADCRPAMDIGTDSSVWACFPLSALSTGVRLEDYADVGALETHFRERFERLYRAGAMDACIGCRHRQRRRCAGACAAHVYRRFQA